MEVNVVVSLGELVDKITILEIKKKNINDKEKLEKINFELNNLLAKLKKLEIETEAFKDLKTRLKNVNQELWIIEDDIRKLEKEKTFNQDFINLARSVYFTNDKRFELKNQINTLFNSAVAEVKSYENYQ